MSLGTLLRRKRVLLAIFLLSLTYFIIATYSQLRTPVVEEEDVIPSVNIDEILKTVKPEVLDVIAPAANAHSNGGHKHAKRKGNFLVSRKAAADVTRADPQSNRSNYSCKNSVQGKSYIADEHGYICDRFDLKPNGCCDIRASSTKRYTCDSCSEAGCCSVFEQCVSCCLHPQKVCSISVHQIDSHCSISE